MRPNGSKSWQKTGKHHQKWATRHSLKKQSLKYSISLQMLSISAISLWFLETLFNQKGSEIFNSGFIMYTLQGVTCLRVHEQVVQSERIQQIYSIHQRTQRTLTHNDQEQYRRASCTLTYLIYCLLYTSPSPRDRQKSRMPSSA